MALTDCTEVIIKEFTYLGAECVRLVHGFDGFDGEEKSAYYAVVKRAGMNLPLSHAEYGIVAVQMMVSGDRENYESCAEKFAEIVKIYL